MKFRMFFRKLFRNSLKISFLIVCACLALNLTESKAEFAHKREIIGIRNQWHKIEIPDELLPKLNPDFSDIKIIGINSKNDSIVAPFIIRDERKTNEIRDVDFNLLNQSKNSNGYYYTFELTKENEINKILLDLSNDNFDWKVKLEASQDQKQWFEILTNYRILSIKNSETNYKFTDLVFPNSKYKYYRLLIQTNDKPELNKAKIQIENIKDGLYKKCRIVNQQIVNDKENKSTIINISLENALPLSKIKLNINANYDYYRSSSIEFLTDSVQTQHGMDYQYNSSISCTLNSIEKNEFNLYSQKAKDIRIRIENNDNNPLDIKSIEIFSQVYSIIARFDEKADYYIYYSDQKASPSNYDIVNFQEKIPANPEKVNLGQEINLTNEATNQSSEAYFKNSAWLWALIIVIIAILAIFSYKMLKSENPVPKD